MSGQNLGVLMQKNHTKMGVAWGSVVLNGPQRVKFFFVEYKKIFRGVSP